MKYTKKDKTEFKCKNCHDKVYKEINKTRDNYPFVCLTCDENMFSFEVEK